MIVMKFGGTSVKDASAISRVCSIAANRDVKRTNIKRIVVVSALATVTNALSEIIGLLKNKHEARAVVILSQIEELHKNAASALGLQRNAMDFLDEKFKDIRQLIKAIGYLGEITPKSMDMILSTGEILSSRIVCEALLLAGCRAVHADARKIFVTDSNFTHAEVNLRLSGKLADRQCGELFEECEVIVCGGFIASDESGRTTTLGRGGSDYSASLLASFLGADRLEIWTDVDGIMTADPRIVNNAKRILRLSYAEAAELAYFGAKVLHPKTIYPAVKADIPVVVLNSFKPENSGTEILRQIKNTKIIKSIAFREGITVINVQSNRMLGAYGFLSEVFDVFKKYETPVDLVTTSEVSISLTIDNDKNLDKIVDGLGVFSKVAVSRGKAIISSIGEGIRDTAGIAARFFGVLKGINVSMVSIGASEVNLSIIIDSEDLDKAVSMLHEEFFAKEINRQVFQEIY